nr:helix-turn-helix domain-containing protein [Aeromicrobium wangtongii]
MADGRHGSGRGGAVAIDVDDGATQLATQPTELLPDATNAIGRMLGLLGDEWTLLIIQQALQGVGRFGQLTRALPISNSTLTSRLNLLVREGLLRRHIYQTNPLRAEYVVTDRSRALWPFMLAIWEWERRWVDQRESLPTMRHEVCGREFSPQLTCGACEQPVEAKDVVGDWGPSGSWERSVPESVTRRRSESDTSHSLAGMFPETMMVLGNRWASALLGAAFRGVTRFSDFETNLGAPPTLVAERLRAFVGIDVLVATQNPQRPDWAEYHLTEKGRAFYPVIAAALQWAQEWFRAPEGPAIVQQHRGCGEGFVATFRCDQCDGVLTGQDITIVERGDRTTEQDNQ